MCIISIGSSFPTSHIVSPIDISGIPAITTISPLPASLTSTCFNPS